MNETVVLTPERILEATEDVLRRFGLAKATVVDVARALDVSHGSVYRHFPSKASARAIFDATSRFHHPAHAEEWRDPELAARIDVLLALLLKGLEAPRKR